MRAWASNRQLEGEVEGQRMSKWCIHKYISDLNNLYRHVHTSVSIKAIVQERQQHSIFMIR